MSHEVELKFELAPRAHAGEAIAAAEDALHRATVTAGYWLKD